MSMLIAHLFSEPVRSTLRDVLEALPFADTVLKLYQSRREDRAHRHVVHDEEPSRRD